jgi:hypothetical protein
MKKTLIAILLALSSAAFAQQGGNSVLATSVTDSGLSSGNTVCATTGGQLTTSACGSGAAPSSAVVLLVDDFLGGASSTTGSIGQLGWNTDAIASGSGSYGPAASTWPNVGIYAIGSGTTSAEGASIYLGGSTNLALGANSPWQSEFIASLSSVSIGAYRVGYSPNGSATKIPASGIYFRFDIGLSDTHIEACVSNSSVETCTSAGQAPSASTYYDLYISSSTTGTITYQVGANSAVTLCASGCTATATIPTSAFVPMANSVATSSSAVTLNLDYFNFYASGLTR